MTILLALVVASNTIDLNFEPCKFYKHLRKPGSKSVIINTKKKRTTTTISIHIKNTIIYLVLRDAYIHEQSISRY